ncbi:MAG: hypothetical protein KatS3mg028_0558 [Bacteroidia bacterium]|nr:MAG: hypothetical protein KatS3mg028_0558 [Bacteroidia bacterium]
MLLNCFKGICLFNYFSLFLQGKNKSMNNVISKLFLFLFFIFVASVCFGAAPPPPPPPPPGCWPPPCIPIDGGVSFLIAAGALYGVKKSYDKFKTERHGRKRKDAE